MATVEVARVAAAIEAQTEVVLAACIGVGRALAGRGFAVPKMVELLRQCRKLADLVDGVGS